MGSLILFVGVGALGILLGVVIFSNANGAIQEIEGLAVLGIGILLIGLGNIFDAIKLDETTPDATLPSPAPERRRGFSIRRALGLPSRKDHRPL
jgi:hypothetical protein